MRTKADIELVSDSTTLRSSNVLILNAASTAPLAPYQTAPAIRPEWENGMISKKPRNALVLAGTLAPGMFIGQAMAQQSHMLSALEDLRTARTELQRALPNKGGHREKAIDLVGQAIDETNTGIRVGRGD
jgi:hypothetical protein